MPSPNPSHEIVRLVLCILISAFCCWFVWNALSKGRVRSRMGLVISARERPVPFYATVGLYSLVLCMTLFGAARMAWALYR